MTRVKVDALSLELSGVTEAQARAALDGLDAELARRLSLRPIDPSRLFTLPAAVRLPDLGEAARGGPSALCGRIAEALESLLRGGPSSITPGGR